MIRKPIFNYQHYLNSDIHTYEFMLPQVQEYEKVGFNTARVMTPRPQYFVYDEFVECGCLYCNELETYLKSYVFRRMYPEMNKGLIDLADKEESISLWNLASLWKYHVKHPRRRY